jgi:predicted N-formylglutamate amidohydrolase
MSWPLAWQLPGNRQAGNARRVTAVTVNYLDCYHNCYSSVCYHNSQHTVTAHLLAPTIHPFTTVCNTCRRPLTYSVFEETAV